MNSNHIYSLMLLLLVPEVPLQAIDMDGLDQDINREKCLDLSRICRYTPQRIDICNTPSFDDIIKLQIPPPCPSRINQDLFNSCLASLPEARIDTRKDKTDEVKYITAKDPKEYSNSLPAVSVGPIQVKPTIAELLQYRESLKLQMSPVLVGISPMAKTLREANTLATKDQNLQSMLLFMIQNELNECDLLIAYDAWLIRSPILQVLSEVPNFKQILFIQTKSDFSSILWTSPRCQGYLFLVSSSQHILSFANEDVDSWDYEGRFGFVGFSMNDLNAMVSSMKGKKSKNILSFVKSESDANWKVYTNQLYQRHKLKRINVIRKGGHISSDVVFFPDKLSDLMGVKLKVVTFPWGGDVYIFEEGNSPQERTGIDVEVTEALAELLNFTTYYEKPPDIAWFGHKTEDGNWTGLLGVLSRDETDIGFPISLTTSRLGILDYTIVFHFMKVCFAVKTEPPLPQWLAISYPFNKWTWLSFAFVFVASGPLLYIFSSVSWGPVDELESFKSPIRSLLYAIGMHFNEPMTQLPKGASAKIFVLSLWLYCLIVVISYSANLKAFLMMKKLPKQIDTLKDLRHSGYPALGYNEFYKNKFLSSQNYDLHALANVFQIVPEKEELYRMMHQGGYVYPEDNRILGFLIARTSSKKGGMSVLRMMKECYGSNIAALALQNYSPLKKKFDVFIGRMMNGGLIRGFYLKTLRLVNEYERHQKKVETSEEDNTESISLVALSMNHMQGLFLITASGWTLAVMLFAAEVLIKYQQ